MIISRDIARQIALLPIVSTRVEIPAANTSALLVAANNSRLDVTLVNRSNKGLWISYGEAATKKDILIKSATQITITNVKADIYGIWDNGSNNGVTIFENSAG